MNKILRKTLLGGLALTAAGSAIALASCGGGSSRFDFEKDKKLKFATTITNKDVQNGLDLIFKTYNDLHKDAGFTWERMEVKGGYPGIDTVMNTNLASKEGKELFNLALGYPSSLAIAIRANMGLPFDKNSLDFSTIFENKFLENNNSITGTKPGDQWTVPVSKSTDMMSLNMPMLAYIFSKAEDDGMTVVGKNVDGDAKTLYNKIKAAGESDKEFIGQVLGDYVSSSDGLKGYQFNFSLFETYESLIDFVKRAGVAFPKFLEKKTDTSNRLVGKALMGIDSSTNSFYAAAFASVGADFKKFLFSLNSDRSEMNFNNVLDKPDSAEQKTLKKVYEAFLKVLEDSQLFIKSQSTYSSNYQKFHQLLVSVGSTAGYQYNYVDGKASIYEVTLQNGEVVSNVQDTNAQEILKPTEKDLDSGKLDAAGLKKEDVLAIIKGKYTNRILKSTTVPTGNKTFRHDIVSKDAAMDAKIQALVDAGEAGKPLGLSLNYELNTKQATGQEILGYVENIKDNKAKIAYFVEKSKYSKDSDGQKKTLQENELHVMPAPAKLSSSDTKKVATLQGPSLFALHANDEEDAETQKFVKWFFTHKQEWTGKVGKKEVKVNSTAAEFFAKIGGYVFPSKEYLKNQNENASNPGLQISLNNIIEMGKEGSDLVPMEDPVESRSSAFRKSLDDSLQQMYTRTGQKAAAKISFEEFLKELKKGFHTKKS